MTRGENMKMIGGLTRVAIALGLIAELGSWHEVQAADLRSRVNQADYIVITPSCYLFQAERLASFRHTHDKLNTMVVTIDSIAAQFTSASTADSSIREFLDHALLQWTLPRPSAVLLMGNVNVMPSHIEPELPGFVFLGYTDSLCIDQWFVEDPPDQWGASRMRCALGRLPGWDSTEIGLMVDRVIAYETADPASWWGRSVGLAEYTALDGHVFEEALQNYQRTVSGVWTDTLSVTMDPASAFYRDSTAFRHLWDEGSAIMMYVGHANAYNFAAVHYFTAGSAALLCNAPRLPLVLSIGCELRFDLPVPTIASRLMSNPSGGAIAAVVSAGVQWLGTGNDVVGGTLGRLKGSPTMAAGRAFALAKDSVQSVYARRYTFLGDPALKVKRPAQIAGLVGPGHVPSSTWLAQNYPNPFNPNSDIRYQVSEFGTVWLAVYDVLGREVAVLVNERKAPGTYQLRFDATGLPSGVYFYSLRSGSYTETKKMVYVR